MCASSVKYVFRNRVRLQTFLMIYLSILRTLSQGTNMWQMIFNLLNSWNFFYRSVDDCNMLLSHEAKNHLDWHWYMRDSHSEKSTRSLLVGSGAGRRGRHYIFASLKCRRGRMTYASSDSSATDEQSDSIRRVRREVQFQRTLSRVTRTL